MMGRTIIMKHFPFQGDLFMIKLLLLCLDFLFTHKDQEVLKV